MRYQQAAMALAIHGLFPGAEAGIMFKRTGQLVGGLEGPRGGLEGPRGPGRDGPGPAGPGPVDGPGGGRPQPPSAVAPPPPPSDTLTPPGLQNPQETQAAENTIDQGPIFVTLSSTENALETPSLIVEPPAGTPTETPTQTPEIVQPPAGGTETPGQTPGVVQTPGTVQPPVETPAAETPSIVVPPVQSETPVETPDAAASTPAIIETPTGETPQAVETPSIISPPPAETPLETPPAATESEAELPAETTGGEVTVTITQDNGVLETVTQTLPAAAVTAVTAVIAQPILIVVEQTTNFNFNFNLGGVCPPVVADPAGSGGFIVGDNVMMPTLPQACQAACQAQFQQCSAKAGQNFQVADCETQLTACNGAAATETLIEQPPQTVTKTVFLPPTEVPGVEQELSSDGCTVITTQTLPPDEVATIGDGGISVITTTAVQAVATGVEPEMVETTMLVTHLVPPAGGVGAPMPSVVTMTMTVSAPPKATQGIEDSDEKPVGGADTNAPPPPPADTNAPPPPAGTNAPPPPPADTNAPPPPAGHPGRPGAGGAAACPEAVTVTVTQAAVTITVTNDGNNVVETPAATESLIAPPPSVTPPAATSPGVETPAAVQTPGAIETPLLPPAGTTLTTKLGPGQTGAPIEIPSQLSVGDSEQPAAEKPAAEAPARGFFQGLFGN